MYIRVLSEVMKGILRFAWLLLLCSFLQQDAWGQAEFRKYSNNFLSIGVGGRAHGMGGAVGATESNIFSSQWNPAGLARTNAPMQVSAMHAEWFAGVVNYDFIGVAKRFNEEKRAYGGLSVVRMGIDNIPNTINLFDPDGSINYDNISSFSAADYGFFLESRGYREISGRRAERDQNPVYRSDTRCWPPCSLRSIMRGA